MLVYADDKKLVKQMLAGDEQAFSLFFEAYFSRLYRFSLARLANDPEAARDVTQVAMCKAVRNLASYRGEAALFTWLCTICRNAIVDWLRQQGRYREHVVLIEDYPAVQAAVESLHDSSFERPDAQQERRELVRIIQVALDRLPAHYGDVLEWKYIEGYSVKEIAERLGLGQEATQSLLARAKRSFADVYLALTESLEAQQTARGLVS